MIEGKKAAALSVYVVLRGDSAEPNVWHEVGKMNTRSAESAVRAHVNGLKSKPHERYVAVPARSWQPLKVAVETKTQVKVEAA
jgi:hypothetical protein